MSKKIKKAVRQPPEAVQAQAAHGNYPQTVPTKRKPR
jgi:hypothetical protein